MGKGRERIRSDRRTPKANAGGATKRDRKSTTAGGGDRKPRPSRAANPRRSKADGVSGEAADGGLLRAPMSVDEDDHANEQEVGEDELGDDLVGDDFADDNDEVDFYEQDDEARRGSLGGGGRLSSGGDGRSSSLSNDSMQVGHANLMLEIMEPADSLATQAGQAATANFRSSLMGVGRTSTAAVCRPPPQRPPVLNKDGTPDRYAFARDELIAAPMGWGQRVVEDQGRAAVTGVSVSQVEGDELKLLEHFADVAMELDEKQLGRSTPIDSSTVPPHPQAGQMHQSMAKQPEALSTATVGGEGEGTGRDSPSGTNGQKRKRSEDSVQYSPELELIGGEQDGGAGGNNAKRMAPAAGGTAAAAAAADAKPEKEKAAGGGGAAAPATAGGAAAAASDAKAHSPAVSPVDGEGAAAAAAAEAGQAGEQPNGGKSADGMARPQHSAASSHIAKTSPMLSSDDPAAAAGVDSGRSEQPSPSAFRRLSSRGSLNLG